MSPERMLEPLNPLVGSWLTEATHPSMPGVVVRGKVELEWLEGKRVVGISSGASAPEELVQRLVEFFRERGTTDVSEFEVVQEDVRFMLPKEIRKALAGAGA